MTDVNGVVQVELFNQLIHVCRVGVHLVAGVRLSGASMSTPIMSDDAKPSSTVRNSFTTQLAAVAVAAPWAACLISAATALGCDT